eukprot:gene3466-14086_t
MSIKVILCLAVTWAAVLAQTSAPTAAPTLAPGWTQETLGVGSNGKTTFAQQYGWRV